MNALTEARKKKYLSNEKKVVRRGDNITRPRPEIEVLDMVLRSSFPFVVSFQETPNGVDRYVSIMETTYLSNNLTGFESPAPYGLRHHTLTNDEVKRFKAVLRAENWTRLDFPGLTCYERTNRRFSVEYKRRTAERTLTKIEPAI